MVSVVLPIGWLLTTIYLITSGKLPKDRWKPWAFISCGILLMNFSGILTAIKDFSISTAGVILLAIGFLIIILTSYAFRVEKPTVAHSH